MDVAYLSVLMFLFLILSSLSESNNQLTQLQPLSHGDMLVSEGEVFALGFFFPTRSSKNLYLGIWYYNIPKHTVVWIANRDNPITAPSSARLDITNNLTLSLSDSRGHTHWETTNNVTMGSGTAFATLLDTGNFILQSGEDIIWRSFDYPTDTILPTMEFLLSYRAQVAMRLVAWKGPGDPSTGDISSSIDPNSNLQVFIWNGTSPYLRTALVTNDVSVSGTTYQSNATYVLSPSVFSIGEGFYYTYTASEGSPYTRMLLDYTGNLRLQIWNNNSLLWKAVSVVPSACDLYASCGPFGFCDHTRVVPACQCIDGFEPIDALNSSSGCRRKEALECGQDDRFLTLSGMKIPDKFVHIRNKSFDQCQAECSRNCSCLAYAYAYLSNASTMGDTSRCLLWTGVLIDMGRATFAPEENLYLRLAAGSSVKNKRYLAKIVPPVITLLLLIATIALIWIYKYRGKRQQKEIRKKEMLEYLRSADEDGPVEFPYISFEDIVQATGNFSESNLLGEGGFGKVYKGVLEGDKEVAIKRLAKGSRQGTEEFRNEVTLIAKLQHKNLIKLLGCCIYEDEKLLVYEYLSNKSLDYFIFDFERKRMLQWPTRHKIIQEVARGILYLHRDSRLTIIHRDLKASNILLDKEMIPKISDFGMARIFYGDRHQANTNRVAGTYGYMSPEYALEGAFSVKSDTYSFGVLLLEIVSGLKISSPHLIIGLPNLIVYAWNLWKDGKTENLLDSSVKESCPLDEVSRFIHIGLLCVQDNPDCRPLMSAVVSMLENKTTQLPFQHNLCVLHIGKSNLEAAATRSNFPRIIIWASQISKPVKVSWRLVTFVVPELQQSVKVKYLLKCYMDKLSAYASFPILLHGKHYV